MTREPNILASIAAGRNVYPLVAHVRLDAETRKILNELGHGKVAAGIREAAQICKRLGYA